MPDNPDWQTAEIDTDTPSAARIYDYSLGGAHNFAVDREAAEALYRILPEGRDVGRANRAFLQRAVRFCCAQGIRQFLDLGSGIPTVGNVHEIAQQVDPECRVVYVDNDPVAVQHTMAILGGDPGNLFETMSSPDSEHPAAGAPNKVPGTAIVQADMRDSQTVLNAPQTRDLLDFSQPIALMMVAVLHYVSVADDAGRIVREYLRALAPGSYLVVSHTTEDPRPEVAAAIRGLFDNTTTPVTHRNRSEVAVLFDGLELVEPGVVWGPQWHPADDAEPLYATPERSATFAGVGRLTRPISTT